MNYSGYHEFEIKNYPVCRRSRKCKCIQSRVTKYEVNEAAMLSLLCMIGNHSPTIDIPIIMGFCCIPNRKIHYTRWHPCTHHPSPRSNAFLLYHIHADFSFPQKEEEESQQKFAVSQSWRLDVLDQDQQGWLLLKAVRENLFHAPFPAWWPQVWFIDAVLPFSHHLPSVHDCLCPHFPSQ